jgi:hypothetical protein
MYVQKILSMPSSGREVKPFASCRRFAACKISINGVKRRHFGKITGPFPPTVSPFATRSARVDGTWRHLAAKVGTSKGRGKQWQTTPKNMPRMQRARTIPVTWLGSGSCQNRPKGWILMIIMMMYVCTYLIRIFYNKIVKWDSQYQTSI